MPKYDYRLVLRDTLAGLEASVKQKVKEGYEIVDREDNDPTLTQALRYLTDPSIRLKFPFAISMRKELTPEEVKRNQDRAKNVPLGEFAVSSPGLTPSPPDCSQDEERGSQRESSESPEAHERDQHSR